MKKIFSAALAVIMICSSLSPFTAFAQETAAATEDDTYFTIEEFESLDYIYATNIQPLATGLIVSYKLGIAKSGSNLLITGSTAGSSEVVKCGFSKLVIQRKKSTESTWSDYKTYEDLYSNSNTYDLAKSVAVPSGYQYRVTATHYAKKSLLSTQKITETTGYKAF